MRHCIQIHKKIRKYISSNSHRKAVNYRTHAEEIARMEAPAHVAVDIKWVSRAQMREFEFCYRSWLMRQGEYLDLYRSIEEDPTLLVGEATITDDGVPSLSLSSAPTNLSNALIRTTNSSICFIEKLGALQNAFQTTYKTVVRNDQYFESIDDLKKTMKEHITRLYY